MVENLTDDALDVVVDVVMVTSGRLARRLLGTREYWFNVTGDFWWEWCDRRVDRHGKWMACNAPIEA